MHDPKKPVRNCVLAKAVAHAIEHWPEQYDQQTYFDVTDDVGNWLAPHLTAAQKSRLNRGDAGDATSLPTKRVAVTCGTRQCVAGWVVVLTPVKSRPAGLDVKRAATVLLGLTGYEANVLFDSEWTPPDGQSVPDYLRNVVATGGAIT